VRGAYPGGGSRTMPAMLRAINAQLEEASRERIPSRDRCFELDTAFHRRCVQGGAGPRLLALHDAIKPQAGRYTRLYVEALVDQLAISVREHESVIVGIERGDCAAAQEAMRTNWRNATERLVLAIEEAGELGSW